ncbi:testis-expressed protein 30 isoform X1 [Clupea harengus]|uniref:Testis-expressed protein 30 isoform X1 n=1 Tax=Clupea harengus TaxID=7950 RepID=A0A6P8GBM0_CLUHA|nr:testis-expressed protein 30 isoform X1 [Clupea harengus]
MAECSEETIKIPFAEKWLDAVITVPDKVADVRTVLVLTHGAGGDMNFRHLVSLAQAVAACGDLCVRFTCKSLNLTYRVKAYGAVLKYLKSHDRFTLTKFFLGGRSMGARAAVSLARQLSDEGDECVQGMVCVSFPLHPPAQTHTHQQRSQDLRALSHQPVLFISGTADNMCKRKLLEELVGDMRAPTAVRWVEGGSHGLTVRGRPEEAVLKEVNTHVTEWIHTHTHVTEWIHTHTSQSGYTHRSQNDITSQSGYTPRSPNDIITHHRVDTHTGLRMTSSHITEWIHTQVSK